MEQETKYFQNDCRVTLGNGTGVLALNDRTLDLNSNRLLIGSNNPGAITATSGGILSEEISNNSYVEWSITNDLNPHTIPFINTSGDQIPFVFDPISGSSNKVQFSTYATAANNTPLPIAPILVDHVRDVNGVDNSANSVDRFWYISSTGSPTVDLTFTYGPGEVAANGNANMRAQRWQTVSNGWEVALPAQTNPTAFSVLVPSVSVLQGPWAIARDVSPLPVELLSFTARPLQNEFVKCEWQTASEINSDYFLVQRSIDAINFEIVGSVSAAGYSNSILEYEFDDHEPYDGVSYYRLQQFDRDGEL